MKKIIMIMMFSTSLLNAQNNKNAKIQHSTLGKKVLIYTSADSLNLKLSLTDSLFFTKTTQPTETEISIVVEARKRFQEVLGIGGAITDASAEVFAGLSEVNKKKLLQAYFDESEGIGYSLIRTNMNSCDFSSESYTYVKEGDKNLSTFDINHELKYKIPFIKQALTYAGKNTSVYVSPWSPPAYMKDNKNMLRGGKLLPEFYQTWANYFVKFIQAYEKTGIPIWGLTIQNEPMATQTWESCIYTAEEERDFLKNYLGPTIKKEVGDKKIIVWDHNRDLMVHRADIIFNDPEASKYAWGTGFHWYETWTGGKPMFQNVKTVTEAYPDKKVIFTEGCAERFNPEKYQFWANGERYGESMINDFNNGAVGWTDWNILLDDKGGPNHVGNFCFAPVHADLNNDKLIFTPSYYYLGHFSKFVQPKAVRLSSAVSRSQLLSVSFINENNKMVTIVMNPSGKKATYILIVGTGQITTEIPPHAIQTLSY